MIYISGKITGIEAEAAQLFEAAENHLRSLGKVPVNPMKLKHDHDKTWESYMVECLMAMVECDEVYMLSNWQDSKGAKLEMEYAKQWKLKVIVEY